MTREQAIKEALDYGTSKGYEDLSGVIPSVITKIYNDLEAYLVKIQSLKRSHKLVSGYLNKEKVMTRQKFAWLPKRVWNTKNKKHFHFCHIWLCWYWDCDYGGEDTSFFRLANEPESAGSFKRYTRNHNNLW